MFQKPLRTKTLPSCIMKTKSWAIALMVLCTLGTSTAQLLYKKGAAILTLDPVSLITNYYLIGGLLIYGVGALLMITAFKGGEVTVLYPIIATGYIWVSLLSIFFLNEAMNLMKWIGVITIIVGIILIGWSSRNTEEIQGAGVI